MAVMEGARERRVGSGIPVNYITIVNFPGGSDEKRIRLQRGSFEFDPWVRKIPWRRACQSARVFLPGEPPWTEVPGSLQSMGSQSFRHD